MSDALPAPAPVQDRLVLTFFLTILFHGIVILGITFTTEPLWNTPDSPTLAVVLVSDQSTDRSEPDDPDYLAQTSQRGSGNTDEAVRPVAQAASPVSLNNLGQIDGTDIVDTDPGQTTQTPDVLVTKSDAQRQIESVPDKSDEPDFKKRTAAMLHDSTFDLQPSPEHEPEARLKGDEVRELVISPNTKEADSAAYLEAWRLKVERVGTLNFPQGIIRDDLSGNPTLEVAIGPDGLLQDILIARSSGHKELDHAALSILRLSAPFDPFPEELRKNYDVIRIKYQYQFTNGALVDSVVGSATTADTP